MNVDECLNRDERQSNDFLEINIKTEIDDDEVSSDDSDDVPLSRGLNLSLKKYSENNNTSNAFETKQCIEKNNTNKLMCIEERYIKEEAISDDDSSKNEENVKKCKDFVKNLRQDEKIPDEDKNETVKIDNLWDCGEEDSNRDSEFMCVEDIKVECTLGSEDEGESAALMDCVERSKMFKNLDWRNNNMMRENIFLKTEEKHQCSYCNMFFTSASYLPGHYNQCRSKRRQDNTTPPDESPILHIKEEPNQRQAIEAAKKHWSQTKGDSERPYRCDLCGHKSKNSSNLNKHRLIHSNERKYRCTICSYSCILSCNLKRHYRIHTGEKPFSCDLCSYACTSKGALKKHKLVHSGVKPFNCDECDYSCITSSHLKRHKQVHTGEKPFACDICEYTCSSSGSLKTHRRIHTGERPFSCPDCDYTCNTSTHLKRHKLLHTGEKPFPCDDCEKAFSTATYLSRHKITHTGEKPYKCDVCSGAFSTNDYLKRHKLLHTGIRPYRCKDCDAGFTNSSNLKNHQKQHSARSKKPFQCERCAHSFTSLGHLKRHALKHSSVQTIRCADCNYYFATELELSNHPCCKKNANNETQTPIESKYGELFPCSECSYIGNTVGRLTRHMKTHSKINIYSCKLCEFTSHDIDLFDAHVDDHAKNVACDLCAYRCKSVKGIKKHRMTHDKIERTISCEKCSYTTTKPGNFRKHVAVHD